MRIGSHSCGEPAVPNRGQGLRNAAGLEQHDIAIWYQPPFAKRVPQSEIGAAAEAGDAEALAPEVLGAPYLWLTDDRKGEAVQRASDIHQISASRLASTVAGLPPPACSSPASIAAVARLLP